MPDSDMSWTPRLPIGVAAGEAGLAFVQSSASGNVFARCDPKPGWCLCQTVNKRAKVVGDSEGPSQLQAPQPVCDLWCLAWYDAPAISGNDAGHGGAEVPGWHGPFRRVNTTAARRKRCIETSAPR